MDQLVKALLEFIGDGEYVTENAVYIDKHIPLELINPLRRLVGMVPLSCDSNDVPQTEERK